jgi:predicted enzyme related to lactoylglutathione lyase
VSVAEAVGGIGGVFFRTSNPDGLRAWYAEHLGIEMESWGTMFTAKEGDLTVWAPFAADTDYFGSPEQQLMVNFRVRDLDAMLAQLRAAGVEVVDRIEEQEYGRFGWATDPEGNRFELWEPPR